MNHTLPTKTLEETKLFMFGIKSRIQLFINKIKWRMENPNNSTCVSNIFNLSSVSVGHYTYGVLNLIDSNPVSKLKIGNFCSIAPNVTFILNSDHYTKNLSSFPFKVMCLHNCKAEAISYGDIIVDDDVWIGYGATILSGVHVGQGAIIAAGALVSKDVPPYAIVGGVPAKVIKFRFSKDVVNYLLSLDYSSLSKELVRDNISVLYKKIDGMSLSDVQLMFDWFPKK